MNSLLAIHWNLNPDISFFIFTFRWYGLFFALGIALAFVLVNDLYKRSGIPDNYMISLLYMVVISAIIGARLGEVLFYDLDFYLKHPAEIIKIWHGGLASHGATIAIVLIVFVYAKYILKKSFFYVGDRVVVGVAIVATFIRIGNFCNSEIVGKASNLPWAVVFERNYTNHIADTFSRHPTQLYEALAYLILCISLYIYARKNMDKLKAGTISAYFLIGMFSFRFLVEFFKEVQQDFEKTLPLDMGQILSIPFIILGFIALWYSRNQKSVEVYKETNTADSTSEINSNPSV